MWMASGEDELPPLVEKMMTLKNTAVKAKCHDKKLFQNGMEKFNKK